LYRKILPNYIQAKYLVLTINGKVELVVQDAASYQQLLNKIEELKAGVEKRIIRLGKGSH